MSAGAVGAIAGAAGANNAQAMIAQAIKASGAIVRVEPEPFLDLVGRADQPLVVTAIGGLFSKNYQYLMGFKGLAFFTKSPMPLTLPGDAMVVEARKIWIPA